MRGHVFVNCATSDAIKCIHCGWEVPRIHLRGCGLTAADLSALICSPQDDDEHEFCEECDLIGDHWTDCSSKSGDGGDEADVDEDGTEYEKLPDVDPNCSQNTLVWTSAWQKITGIALASWLPNPPQAATLAYLDNDCTCPTLLNGHHPECPREKK